VRIIRGECMLNTLSNVLLNLTTFAAEHALFGSHGQGSRESSGMHVEGRTEPLCEAHVYKCLRYTVRSPSHHLQHHLRQTKSAPLASLHTARLSVHRSRSLPSRHAVCRLMPQSSRRQRHAARRIYMCMGVRQLIALRRTGTQADGTHAAPWTHPEPCSYGGIGVLTPNLHKTLGGVLFRVYMVRPHCHEGGPSRGVAIAQDLHTRS